ncbi:MAG TPA: DUF2911 domain-containing protein [Chitinophagaceae bacterium]|jgi:hypothetical protein|nr:DUF2911 domain-containing protein [Chitinophagaceae bacterium]
MKSLLFVIAALIMIPSFAQERKSPHEAVTNGVVTVAYGRPYKKDREIFGKLEPYNKVYRVGADEATTISFTKKTKFGGQDVEPGIYTLFAVPTEQEWTIILNGALGQWGAYSYEKNKAKDVTSFKVPVTKLGSPIEQLTIRFADGSLVIEWDTTQVKIPFTTPK